MHLGKGAGALSPGFSSRAAVCAFVLTLLCSMGPGAARLAAQQDEDPASQDVALLVNGPALARGMPFLPANVIPHYRGRYEYKNSIIDVFYTENEIVRFSGWQALDCGDYRLYQLRRPRPDENERPAEGNDGQAASRPLDGASEQSNAAGTLTIQPVFFYQTDEYSLFIRLEQRYLCTFFPRFMSKFIYFGSVQNMPTSRPPFPAVVD